MSSTKVGSHKRKQENTLLNIVFNIVLPVVILNQLSRRLGEDGPMIGLLLALSLPLGYGTYEYIKNKKHNWMSVLGLVNIMFTGGFALIKLEGLWFAVKEATFPLVIGLAVLISAMTKKPLFKALLWNESIINTQHTEAEIKARHNGPALERMFKRTTIYFSVSFFISALLNLILALRIFTPLDAAATESQRAAQLNEQIAAMTWQGYVVIALPLMVLMMGLLWYTLRELQRISGLSLEELMPNASGTAPKTKD